MKKSFKLKGLIQFTEKSVIDRFIAAGCGGISEYHECVKKIESIKHPKACQILIDNGCNQNCRHCFLGLKKNRTQTPTDKINKVATALKKQGYVLEGYSTEPLVSEEAFKNFIKFAIPNRTHFLTNGTAALARVSGKELADRFLNNGVRYVRTSLHGSTAETH